MARRRFRSTLFVFVLMAVGVVFLLAGCSRGYSRSMKLPADPVYPSGMGWAAVSSAYAQAKALPDKDSADIAVIRRGTVFKCDERKIDPAGVDIGGLWYRYREGSIDGWIHMDDLSIFSSEEQARKEASNLR